jgi:hypothetical protein
VSRAGGRVATIAGPTPFVNPGSVPTAAFGVPQVDGSGLAKLADVGSQILIKEKIEDNERESRDLDNQLSSRIRHLMQGDALTPGLMSLQGAAYLKRAAEVQKELAEAQRTIGQQASNSAVARTFGASADQRVNRALGQVGHNAGVQRRIATLTTAKASLLGAVADASVPGASDETIAASVRTALSTALIQAEVGGLSKEGHEAVKRTNVSQVYAGAITQAIADGNTARAKELLKLHRKDMMPAVATKLTKFLKTSVDIQRGQAIAAEALQKFPDPGQGKQRDAWVRSKTKGKPDVQSQAFRAMDNQVIRSARNKRIADGAMKDMAAAWVNSGGSIQEFERLHGETAEALKGVDGGTYWRGLVQAERNKLRGAKWNDTSEEKYLNKLENMSITELAEQRVETIRALLDEVDGPKWLDRRRLARFEAAKTTKANAAEVRRQLNFGLKRGKELIKQVAGDKWDLFERADNVEETNRGNRMLKEAYDWWAKQIEQGKVPTPGEFLTEVENIVRAEQVKVSTPGASRFLGITWGGTRYSSANEVKRELTPEQQKTVRVRMDDMPEAKSFEIRKLLRKNGRTGTDAEVENYAGAEAMGQKERMQRILRPNRVSTTRRPDPTPDEGLLRRRAEAHKAELAKETERFEAEAKRLKEGSALTPKEIEGKFKGAGLDKISFETQAATETGKPKIEFQKGGLEGADVSREEIEKQAETERGRAAKNVSKDGLTQENDLKGKGKLKPTGKLLTALMHQESAGKTGQVSRAGAIGLFQLMPNTIKQPGFGVKPISKADARDPVKARVFSEQYLGAMLDRYKKNGANAIKDALMAYNGGAGDVDKWIRDGRKVPGKGEKAVRVRTGPNKGVFIFKGKKNTGVRTLFPETLNYAPGVLRRVGKYSIHVDPLTRQKPQVDAVPKPKPKEPKKPQRIET